MSLLRERRLKDNLSRIHLLPRAMASKFPGMENEILPNLMRFHLELQSSLKK
ncbi:hypothetical protein YC2023_008896 [Brassica napus]